MRQWLFLLLAIACVAAASQLLPGINQGREALMPNPVAENMPPELVLATTALGGFRGVIVDILWLRAMKLQQEEKFFELVQLFDWIGKLEPRCVPVWVYAAWNMAYNISVELPNAPERWMWVKQGISRLRDHGIPYNQRAAELYRELGWIYSHKIGSTSDTCHWHYKTQLATEVEDVMGRGPAVDLDPFVSAAKSMEELTKRCDPQPLLRALTAAGYQPLRKPAAVSAGLGEEGSEVQAIFNAAEHANARDEVEMFVRAKALREHLKLDPEYMHKLSKSIGPMDWRLSDPHALYYASKAKELATSEDFSINYDRIRYEAVRRLYLRGSLFFDRGTSIQDSVYLTSSNWRFIDVANQIYLEFVQKREAEMPGSVDAAHRSFLEEAIVLLFVSCQTNKSREYFAELRKRYPNEMYRVPYEQFISAAALGATSALSHDQTKVAIDGVLLEAYRWLAAGHDDRSRGLFNLAAAMWKQYMTEMDVAEVRMGMPPFQTMRRQAYDQAMRVLPQLLRERLKERIGTERGTGKGKEDDKARTSEGQKQQQR